MNKEYAFAWVVIIFVFVSFCVIDISTTHIFIPDSDKCDYEVGFYFSNSTADELYGIGNFCFGINNDGFKTYNIKDYAKDNNEVQR